MAEDPQSQAALWVFGYGSLLWRPGFSYTRVVPGFIRGFVRRFYQGSTDHRGLPDAPGRVVTLHHEPAGKCGGLAYAVAASQKIAVLAALDYREKGGYRRIRVPFFPKEAGCGPGEVLVYFADQTNPNYLGPASAAAMAAQIRSARGPSGANSDYLRQLHRALDQLQICDAHVSELLRQMDGGAI